MNSSADGCCSRRHNSFSIILFSLPPRRQAQNAKRFFFLGKTYSCCFFFLLVTYKCGFRFKWATGLLAKVSMWLSQYQFKRQTLKGGDVSIEESESLFLFKIFYWAHCKGVINTSPQIICDRELTMHCSSQKEWTKAIAEKELNICQFSHLI